MRIVRIALLLAAGGLAGCARLGYYAHLAGGQIELLRAREPIVRILDDPARDPALQQRLRQVQAARGWAADHLRLPDSGSYTQYADLGRPYVVWNVYATPEFSLRPLEQCFPFAGCLAYQGFYTRERAQARADALAGQGYDVHVGGVPAYSTLGWFDDPVLSTMMQWSDAALIATLFHELAHQKLYVQNDTRFNESYARFVEEQGLDEYLADRPELAPPDPQRRGRRTQFVQLVLAARLRLEALYAQPLDAGALRAGKAAVFAQLKADYEGLRDRAWGGDRSFDAWFADLQPNNARLLPFGLYDEYTPAFAALYEQSGRDWARFHEAAAALAALAPAQRQARLDSLLRRRRPE